MTKILAELMEDGKHVAVVFPYDPRLVEAIRRVPSRKWVENPTGPGGYNRLLADLTIMRRLREEMGPDLRLGPKLREWGHEQVEAETKLRDMAQASDARLQNVPNKLVWGLAGEKKRLRPYQRADIKVMAERNVVNANQPGAGKTAEVILALAEAELLHGYHLIDAPVASLRLVWEMEIEAIYAALGCDPPTILTGDTPDERRAAIAEAVELHREGYSFWLLINPAMTRARDVAADGDLLEYLEASMKGELSAKPHPKKVLNNPALAEIDWTSFVIDEFHLMGLANPQTQGHQGAKAIFDATKPARSYVLSGTPIRGKPIKLWGALNFLYPDRFGSRWRWAETWLVVERGGEFRDVETGYTARTQTYIGGLQPGKEEEFGTFHAQYMVRRTTREALPGMPEKLPIEVWCDMSEKQAEQYRTFELEAEWQIKEMEEAGIRLTATNILAIYTRLKQFSNAYCEVTQDRQGDLVVSQTRDSGKLAQLLERLSEEAVLGSDDPAPALIFSQFNAMTYMVAEILEEKGLRVGVINGIEKQRDRTARGRAFEAAELDVLVMNTMAGTALNLARAESVHLLDETWTPDDQEQAEDRAFGGHRAVGKAAGRCYYYRTRNTIEERIKAINRGKAWNNKMALDLRRSVQAKATSRNHG